MFSATSIAMASLKQTEGEQDFLGTILLAVLNRSILTEGVPLTARLMDDQCESLPQIWARCDQGILIHIDVIDSQSQIFCDDRLNDLARSLDAAEPILSAIESVTGCALDPVQLITVVPREHAVIELSRVNQADRIFIAFPREFDGRRELEILAEKQPVDLSHVPVAYSLLIKGPMMDVDGVADVSVGDLLLLGGASVSAAVSWKVDDESQATVDGSYDFASGQFVSANGGGGFHTVSVYQQGSADSTTARNSTAYPVRLTACIEGFTTAAGDLAAVQSGSILYVGKLTAGTNVSLSLSENEMFSGTLVQLADHFAVQIDMNTYFPQPADSAAAVAGEVL